ncbi:hypothetical protein Pla108_36460 [Botrimarina colliarenosi]|uniref:PEP-CTERM protein-sorting domain-containing protein n=1 Tax=Botrimarina colliarenosi TaxID=2528001 RepID=A0A5C6A5U2_9BACT|nr:hypothetical protein [Botrimarina colliarenosi]TWT94796.1 hypothetical protein Pla108_36460 [Botrimarina colliarenosi]
MRHPSLALLCVSALNATLAAEPITFSYTAVRIGSGGSIPGEAVYHGEYTFESIALEAPGTLRGLYNGAVTDWTLRDEFGALIARTADADIRVGDNVNPQGSDIYNVSSFGSTHDPALVYHALGKDWSLFRMDIRLEDATGTAFDSFDLPLLAPSLGVFTQRAILNLGFSRPVDGGTFVTFALTSLVRVTPVPEPSTTTTFLALAAISSTGYRRKRLSGSYSGSRPQPGRPAPLGRYGGASRLAMSWEATPLPVGLDAPSLVR